MGRGRSQAHANLLHGPRRTLELAPGDPVRRRKLRQQLETIAEDWSARCVESNEAERLMLGTELLGKLIGYRELSEDRAFGVLRQATIDLLSSGSEIALKRMYSLASKLALTTTMPILAVKNADQYAAAGVRKALADELDPREAANQAQMQMLEREAEVRLAIDEEIRTLAPATTMRRLFDDPAPEYLRLCKRVFGSRARAEQWERVLSSELLADLAASCLAADVEDPVEALRAAVRRTLKRLR